MNQTIRESGALLACMRQRAQGYNDEARRSAGLPVERQPRFQVHAQGGNQFQVVERTTGVVRGERTGHNQACMLADDMEGAARAAESRSDIVKAFGRTLTKWALAIAALMLLFAYYGAHHGGVQ